MDSNTSFRAELIASAITANCEAYHDEAITRGQWSREQDRLWKLAAESLLASQVMALVDPYSRLSPPPYAIRALLREATLKVGR